MAQGGFDHGFDGLDPILTHPILWDDGRRLLEQMSEEADAISEGNLLRWGTLRYAQGYNTVYKLCTQESPHNYSGDCYDFCEEMAEKYAKPPGRKRDIFIKAICSIFRYTDRFYVKRERLWELAPMMTKVMECPRHEKVRQHLLKKAFLSWALNEDLLGETHADGGKAKKRQRVLYDALQEQLLDAAHS